MPAPHTPAGFVLTTPLVSQFQAALAMLSDCIVKCPDALWESPIAKYPFWLVAYHALYCTEGYLLPDEHAWQPDPRFHPCGRADVEDEYPSRTFSREEIAAYLAHVRDLARRSLTAETPDSLAGPSGFARLPFTRAELHLYNLRHLSHHTGQLSALLHRHNVPIAWVKAGAAGS